MFGNRIKKLRKERGLTQTELAKQLNTTQKNISKYELEFLDLNTKTAIAIADYFGVSIDYLLGRDDFEETKMNRIKELRLEHELTQKELATALNITQDSISLWETSKRIPDTCYVIQLADFFGVTTDYLLGREDDFGVVKRESPADKDSEELLSLYRELTPSTQEAIKETIRQLVARQNGATDTGEIK